MKILQVATSLRRTGAPERQVELLVTRLRETGHEAEVAVSPGSPLAETLGGRKIRSARRLDLNAIAAYVRLMRRGRFEVVHIHMGADVLNAGYAARLAIPGATRWLTRHLATPWSARKSALYRRIIHRIATPSEVGRAALLAAGVPEGMVAVIPPGVEPKASDTPRETIRTQTGLTEDAFVCATFGRVTRERGIDILMKAVPSVEGMTTIIYGDGKEAEPLMRLCSSLRLGGRVLFEGHVADLAAHLKAADVVALPTRWEEAFPYPAIEAASVGMPIVASRIGAMEEALENRVSAVMFEKEDHLGLASALGWVRDDPGLRRTLGAAARERYETFYRPERFVERTLAAYETAARTAAI